MRVVWKYVMNQSDCTFAVPVGAKFRHAAIQYGKLCLWLEVEPDYARVDRRFFAFGTGEEFDPARKEFRATVLTEGEVKVWHVYEEVLV